VNVTVIPAKAGILKILKKKDSRLRGNDTREVCAYSTPNAEHFQPKHEGEVKKSLGVWF